jgi:phytochrome-interacting factor 4
MKQDAESESAALERKPPQKLSTVRRSRAAEVHNLSERVRRVILVVSSKTPWSTL